VQMVKGGLRVYRLLVFGTLLAGLRIGKDWLGVGRSRGLG